MSTTEDYGYALRNPLKDGIDSPEMAAILVLGALGLLILIRRGFRGISVAGASVRVG